MIPLFLVILKFCSTKHLFNYRFSKIIKNNHYLFQAEENILEVNAKLRSLIQNNNITKIPKISNTKASIMVR